MSVYPPGISPANDRDTISVMDADSKKEKIVRVSDILNVNGVAGSGSSTEITLSTTDHAANTIALQAVVDTYKKVTVIGNGIYPIKGGAFGQAIITLPTDSRLVLDAGVTIDNLGNATGYPKSAFGNKNSMSNAIAVTSIAHTQNTAPSWWNTITVNIGSAANPFSGGDYIYIRPAYSAGDTTGFFNHIYRVVSVNNTDPANKKISYEIPCDVDTRVPVPTGALIVYQADSNIRISGNGLIRMLAEDPRDTSTGYGKLGYIQVALNKIIDSYVSAKSTGSRGATTVCFGNAFNCKMEQVSNVGGASATQVYGPAYGIEISGCAGTAKDDLVACFTNGSVLSPGVFAKGFVDTNGTDNSNGPIIGLDINFKGGKHTHGASRSVLLMSDYGNIVDNVVISGLTAFNFTKHPFELGTTVGGGVFGHIKYKDCNLYPRIGARVMQVMSNGTQSVTIKKITLDNVNVPGGSVDGNSGLCNGLVSDVNGMIIDVPLTSGTVVIDNVVVKDSLFMFDAGVLATFNMQGIFLQGKGLIGKLVIDNVVTGSTGANKSVTFVYGNNNAVATGIKEIAVKNTNPDFYFGTLIFISDTETQTTRILLDNVNPASSIQWLVSGLVTGSKIIVKNCDFSAIAQGLYNGTGATVKTLDMIVGGNYGNGKRLVNPLGTNKTINTRSMGGNNVGNMLSPASNTLNFYGNCEDLAVDIAGISRIDGARVWNTNTAAGTINAVGPVYCQGTAALSWQRFISSAGVVSAQEY